MTRSSITPNKKNKELILVIILHVILLLVLYGQTVSFDYVYFDDNYYVLGNSYVRAGLTLESVQWAFTSFYMSNWHPVTWLSHMLDVSLFDISSAWAHAHNAVLHLVNSLLVYWYLTRFMDQRWVACVLSLIFLVHPLHVESVAWIAERKDLLCALFYLMSLLFYDQYQRNKQLKVYICLILSFTLALLSKPMAVTLPAVLVILDLCVYRHQNIIYAEGSLVKIAFVFWQSIKEKWLLFCLSLVLVVITIVAQGQGNAIVSIQDLSLLMRLGNAVDSYFIYLRQFLFPVDLAAFYPLNVLESIEQLLVPVVVMSLIGGVAFWSFRIYPMIACGVLIYLVMLLPVIGILQVGGQAHADRYMYLPSVGLLIACIGLLPNRIVKYHTLVSVLSVCILTYFSIISYWQIGYWQNRHFLFSRVLQVVGPNFRSHIMLAEDYLLRGMVEQAKYHAINARDLNPKSPYVYRTIGNLALKEENYEEAEKLYQYSISLGGQSSETYSNLGVALYEQGKREEGYQAFQAALAIQPNMVDAQNYMLRYHNKE